MHFKKIIKKAVGAYNLGRLDYFRLKSVESLWGGAFNGQEFRRKMFNQICDVINFKQIVETGTFRGNTTEFMSKRAVPIQTIEYDKRLYGYLTMRFLLNRSITLIQGDSREGLKSIALNCKDNSEPVFFYLDAHWNDDLPLKEELEIIFLNWRNAVVMIDDFKVPDTDYGYDDYGSGKALTLEYLENIPQLKQCSLFFPAQGEQLETGKRRGSIVICLNPDTANILKSCDSLRHY